MNNMIRYVCGLMFNTDKTKVALIKKLRPKWQKGLLNGIGGKIESGEASIDAMCREFSEEAGLKTFYYDWRALITLVEFNEKWSVDFYYSDSLLPDLNVLKSMTDEEIIILDVANLDNESVVSNLKWLIRMCFDKNIIKSNIKTR